MAKILVLHGPNLNLLGTREPEVYGAETLQDIVDNLTRYANNKGHELESFQSNAETQKLAFFYVIVQFNNAYVFHVNIL